jgi:hypothetical protein
MCATVRETSISRTQKQAANSNFAAVAPNDDEIL